MKHSVQHHGYYQPHQRLLAGVSQVSTLLVANYFDCTLVPQWNQHHAWSSIKRVGRRMLIDAQMFVKWVEHKAREGVR